MSRGAFKYLLYKDVNGQKFDVQIADSYSALIHLKQDELRQKNVFIFNSRFNNLFEYMMKDQAKNYDFEKLN